MQADEEGQHQWPACAETMFIYFVEQYLINAFFNYLITSLIQDNVSMLNTGVLSRGVLLLQQEVVHLQDLILQGLDLDDFSCSFQISLYSAFC